LQCGGKLHRTHTGPLHTVFAHVLRGLSGARITRAKPEVFLNHAKDGCAVRCSYKADDGFLYPLEKCFFYVHKPAMAINHSEIEYVEFQRQGGGVISSSVRTFDLLIKQRNNNTVSCCSWASPAAGHRLAVTCPSEASCSTVTWWISRGGASWTSWMACQSFQSVRWPLLEGTWQSGHSMMS
jgi:hypothetical protein